MMAEKTDEELARMWAATLTAAGFQGAAVSELIGLLERLAEGNIECRIVDPSQHYTGVILSGTEGFLELAEAMKREPTGHIEVRHVGPWRKIGGEGGKVS